MPGAVPGTRVPLEAIDTMASTESGRASPPATSIDLGGQVAVVTGGGRGLGRAIACALARAGATVAVIARSEHELDTTVGQITEAGGRSAAFPADVSATDAVRSAIASIRSKFGPVDLLVNNAGVSGPIGPLSETDTDSWWQCLETNLRGTFLCSRSVLPEMISRQRGRIINAASGAGTMAIPYLSAYVTSKAALLRLTENLAAEVRAHGVFAFAIEPGTVRTAMAESAINSAEGQTWLPWLKAIFDEGRDVTPDAACHLVLDLAAGRADHLSGRFFVATEDFEAVLTRSEQVVRDEMYLLRMRRLFER
jgi:NAD(P)-dependent dehydrogenase (short-subunit alcohol dehydrogenase family)